MDTQTVVELKRFVVLIEDIEHDEDGRGVYLVEVSGRYLGRTHSKTVTGDMDDAVRVGEQLAVEASGFDYPTLKSFEEVAQADGAIEFVAWVGDDWEERAPFDYYASN